MAHPQRKLEDPHMPLVIMTILTQISLGGFFTLLLLDSLSFSGLNLPSPTFWMAALVLVPAALGLPISALHLGRPFRALGALRKINSSWLSREGWGLGIFTFGMTVVVLFYLLDTSRSVRILIEIIVFLVGIFGTYAQSMIYRVDARPSWNRVVTTRMFFGAGYIGILLCGFAALLQGETGLVQIAITVALLAGLIQVYSVREHDSLLKNPDKNHPAYDQLIQTGEILQNHFGFMNKLRHGLLYLGAIGLPLFVIIFLTGQRPGPAGVLLGISLIMAAGSEFMGRYLFFITVVPLRLP